MSQATALHVWEDHDAEFWRRTWGAGVVRLYAKAGSTNDIAAELAAGDAPGFSVVLAEEQTQGRGRGGARWHARAGSSLLFSVLFRTPHRGDAPGAAPIRVGVAVADVIAETTGADARVKWPNDVVLAPHGKVAGILCEGALGHGRGGYVIAGVGINVSQSGSEFTRELRRRACSIASATGVQLERAALLTAVLDRLRACAGRVTEPLSQDELQRFSERDLLRDREVECTAAGQVVHGIARGVAPDGALLIEQQGVLGPVYAGTVRLAESHAYPGSQ